MVVRTTNEELKKELERIQDEELKTKMPFTNNDLKKQLEQAQDKIFERTRIYNGGNAFNSVIPTFPTPKIKVLEGGVRFGYHDRKRICSNCAKNDEVWAKERQDIYLTFSYDKLLSHWKKNDQGEYYVFHDELPTKITENYCLLCAKTMWKMWGEFLNADYQLLLKEKARESIK